MSKIRQVISIVLILGLFSTLSVSGATRRVRSSKRAPAKAAAKPKSKAARSKAPRARWGKPKTKRVAYSPWREPTFADSTTGDNIDGEDLTVRRAAVDALGPFNGSVVVVDPQTGRLLTVVNQKLAFNSGYIPCSTVKVVTALAALSEGLMDRNTMMRVYRRTSMNLTDALAHSNNPYFANLGIKLGFDKVAYYAKLYGLGEKATTSGEEHPVALPEKAPAEGGVGMMTSFGTGIKQSPLQLAALISSVANGGTLYYLQHPASQEEVATFTPKVKRTLDIAPYVSEILPGMMGAVEYGTARRANYDPNEPIFGKDRDLHGRPYACSHGLVRLLQ